jgi:hypothetical protein
MLVCGALRGSDRRQAAETLGRRSIIDRGGRGLDVVRLGAAGSRDFDLRQWWHGSPVVFDTRAE